MAATMAATRLYVGGLGERVTESDIRTTFSNLGSVKSVKIIRTKGRSFGYIDFQPLSDNSLTKLFSTYNGCSWKGGKLKLEKAKQHYIDRLKQEWAEAAELQNIEDTKNNVDESMVASPQLKSTLDLEKLQFRLFFPKLRKVKSLPFRGTGKHKYSFQRVQVPSLPRLFCDCPEHCDPVETPKVSRVHDSDIQRDTVNGDEVNMMNSVMNRFLNKGTSKQESIQHSREDCDHDSLDGGMNDEEINVMNSVMKKLFDRETAKTQRKDIHESLHMNVQTPKLEENVNKMEEEIDDDDDDDDDIKINVGSGRNVGYDSWETSLVNKMAGSSEQRTSDAISNKLDTGNRKVKPLTKKRKSVSNKSNDKDLAHPVHRKRAHLETQSNEVEEHLPLKAVKESETNKSFTVGMWSQKSSWKELIGDATSGSFQLSNIKPGGQANNVDELISGGGTSSDKDFRRNRNIVNNEQKPSIITSSDKVELEIRSLEHANVDDKSLNTVDAEGIQAAQPLESSADLDKVARGSSWLQKSSWTQLVSGGNSSSFSISQIIPGDVLEKQQLSNPKDDSTLNNNSGALVNERRMSGTAFGGARGSRFGFGGIDKKKEALATDARGSQLDEARKGDDSSGLSMAKKSEIEKKKASNSQPGVEISETCLFMRSADSLKEWQTAKAALTRKTKQQ